MQITTLQVLLSFVLVNFISISFASKSSIQESFCQCFSSHFPNKPNLIISQVIFAKNTSNYSSVLYSSIQNLGYWKTSKPLLITTPFHENHIQATAICSKKSGLQVRVRSGGHDYEGLSYASHEHFPFVVIDLGALTSIEVDTADVSAWVDADATLGELYYAIAEESNVYGFAAGECPTVGVGGFISGGGLGNMFRKYGLAADNVVDAKIVNVNGRILDRESMAEDLFWVVRGWGGSSFGVILSWRIRLVPVPPKVTIFKFGRNLEQGAPELLHKWQTIGHEIHQDLFLHPSAKLVNSSACIGKTSRVSFLALLLCPAEKLVPLIYEIFPDLGLESSDCLQKSWIESVLYFAGFSIKEPLEVLLQAGLSKRKVSSKENQIM